MAGTVRHRSVWVVAAVIAVAMALGIAGWRVHEGRGPQVGDRFDGVTVFSGQAATTQRLGVPVAFGSLSVTLSSGTEIGENDDLVKAPDGATLVEVSWAPASSYVSPAVWPTATARQRRDPGAELTLVTGGRRYPVAHAVTAADERGSAVVVVHGDGADARLESRFAGRTFASSEGQASPRTPKVDRSGCDDDTDGVYSRVTCSLPIQRAAYVPGLGAAPAGKEWLVVSGATTTRESLPVRIYRDKRPSLASYVPTGAPPSVSITVAGTTAKPRTAGPDKVTGDDVLLADRAWLVPAGKPSNVRLQYRLATKLDTAQSDRHDAPRTYEVDVSTTSSYPAA